MNRQKGVLVDVVKQVAITLLKGLTLAHISLPIKIFEPRSAIHRLVDMWSYAPKFLKRASQIEDPLERFKYVIAFQMGSLYICSSQYKPFNPILGETFQGAFSDDSQIYCEHTSHHPPITNFHIQDKDDEYEYWGYYEVYGQMGANSLKSGLRGPNNLRFKDGQQIVFKTPDFLLCGTVMGDRTIEATGSTYFYDRTNNFKAVIVFSTYTRSGFWNVSESGRRDEYRGVIYKATPALVNNANDVYDLGNLQDMEEKICDIKGSWLRTLEIDGAKYWDIDSDEPERARPLEEVIPSDWRFREDLLWLRYGDMKIAQKWKYKMEEQQRKDRRNRHNSHS